MSERSGSKAISVYLSPRAKKILDNYLAASDFGSTSRTVEEIILAYDSMYNGILGFLLSGGLKALTNPVAVTILFTSLLKEVKIRNGTEIEKIVNENVLKELKEMPQSKNMASVKTG